MKRKAHPMQYAVQKAFHDPKRGAANTATLINWSTRVTAHQHKQDGTPKAAQLPIVMKHED